MVDYYKIFNALEYILIEKYDFNYKYVHEYLNTLNEQQLDEIYESGEYNIVQNYIIWESIRIFKPQIQHILYSNTTYTSEIISKYMRALTPLDYAWFLDLGDEFILDNFNFWLRRYKINELSQNN